MDIAEIREKVGQAEDAIKQILETLEEETGCAFKSMYVEQISTSTMENPNKSIISKVDVELRI